MIAAATDRRQIRPVCTCGRAVEGWYPVRRESDSVLAASAAERRYGGRWMAATDFPVRAGYRPGADARLRAADRLYCGPGISFPLAAAPPARSSPARRASAPSGSQNPDLRQLRSRASHLARSSGISPKLTPDLANRARAYLCFLTCLFFCSRRWDTPFALVGHPPRSRQEAARDDVAIDAARAPLARDDALLRPVGPDGGTPCSWAVPWRAARVRTEGKHVPVRSANATRFCSVQCRCRRTVRYRSRVTGTNDSKRASGVAAQPARKRLNLGALCPCTPNRACENRRFRGSSSSPNDRDFPASPDMQTRLSRRVLLFRVLGVAASRKWSRARSGFRAQRERAPGSRGEQPVRSPKDVNGLRSGGCSSALEHPLLASGVTHPILTTL